MKYLLCVGGMLVALLWPAVSRGRAVGPSRPGAAKSNRATVKLVSRGVAPRAVLRYRPRPGKTTLWAKVRMGMQLMRSRTMWTTLSLSTQVVFAKPLPTGEYPYRVWVRSLRLDGKPMSAGAKAKLGQLALTGRLSPEGRTRGVQLAAKNISASTRQALEQYRQCMAQSFVTFPRQAVGRGGVWEVREWTQVGLTGAAIHVLRVSRYRLVRRRGNTVFLRVTARLSAKPQRAQKGASTVTVHRLRGTSQGSLRLDLARFRPRVTTSSASTVEIETAAVRVALKAHQRIKVTSK